MADKTNVYKVKPIEHGGRIYNQRLMQLAHIYMNVRDCKNCGSPINDGYVCWVCNVDDTAYGFVKQKAIEKEQHEQR